MDVVLYISTLTRLTFEFVANDFSLPLIFTAILKRESNPKIMHNINKFYAQVASDTTELTLDIIRSFRGTSACKI